MLNSLLSSIFGCAHNRTTFPLTPSRNSKRSEGARRGTYIVCLDCGKEFAYNWKEMHVGSPVEVLPIDTVQPQAHYTEQPAAHYTEQPAAH
jgi:hypothetical protein